MVALPPGRDWQKNLYPRIYHFTQQQQMAIWNKIETGTPPPDTNPEPEALSSATHDWFMTVVKKEEGINYSNIEGR